MGNLLKKYNRLSLFTKNKEYREKQIKKQNK